MVTTFVCFARSGLLDIFSRLICARIMSFVVLWFAN